MSDYRRFVSYIYEYEQGEKRESKGFVRVNVRGGEYKLQVHLQGEGELVSVPCRIYLFARDRGKLMGQLLGEAENRNGSLEWSGILNEDFLSDRGIRPEESRGLYLESGGRIFAADWENEPVEVEQFVPVSRYARQASESNREPEKKEAPVQAAQLEGAPKPEKISKLEEELKPEEVPKSEEVTATESEEVEASMQKEDPRREQWKYLSEHFPVMRYLDAKGGQICAIRLSANDLSRLPRDRWELGNNSFLLHGLYQYRHILLLRKQTGQEICYQVGIPGVYREREQMMASMFGFQEFKVMKGPEVRQGSFGYWCRALG